MSLVRLQEELAASRANAVHHPFFSKFMGKKTPTQIQSFALQWYAAACNHKKAFPFLVAITEDDVTRCELIEILRDEYGNGDSSKIHSRLLSNFMCGTLGFTHTNLEHIEIIPEVAEFGAITLKIWQGDPVVAYGYHYALEQIAAGIHPVFLAGLEGYGFSPDALEYFRYHSRAEEEHVHAAEPGFKRYDASDTNTRKLQEGVEIGVRSLARMWDGFDKHVFN